MSAPTGRNWRLWAARRAMRRDARKSPCWRIAAITMARRCWLASERACCLTFPRQRYSGNAKRGLFTVQDFIYDAENDRYTCPAGEFLTKGKIRSDRRDDMDHYRNLTACLTCGLKPQSTSDSVKNEKRWQH